MKCPKCAYLGFETSERCRNCGYDFSLSVQIDSATELPLHDRDGAGAPFADFDLSGAQTSRTPDAIGGMDLDRMIGADAPAPISAAASSRPVQALPLFSRTGADVDDAAAVTVPRPARPPLSVRRTTPEIPRGRARNARSTPRTDDAPLGLDLDSPEESDKARESEREKPHASTVTTSAPLAGAAPRLIAALLDTALVVAVDAAVLYLTLAISGITIADVARIPAIPIGAFFLMMNGGYVIIFTAASGQTIGKMVTGIRVMNANGSRVDLGGSMLRAAGCAASLLSLGLGYLPAFFSAERRALQDRIAGTRVVAIQ
jgi:uncharacterized RDD family membrane protein YckC